ncbi:MAG: hypothetical protein QOC68_2671 [Solirubrobacteraceae bacterium]|jgi:uncharacterized membrane protein YkoI|nr:hypothetical protein [Solirubrobacteraceae bacterium]
MFSTARRTVVTFAALGALALGGSAVAGAAQNGSSTASSTATPSARQGQPPNGGRHVGANGKTEQALSAATAAKVKAAALKKVPGGTIERVETDVDHGSPYEAHVTKSDGTQLEVLVNNAFQVTAVNTMQHP